MFLFKSPGGGGGAEAAGAGWGRESLRGKEPPQGCARAVRGRDLGESAWLARAPDEEVQGDHRDEEAAAAGAPPGSLGSAGSGRFGGDGVAAAEAGLAGRARAAEQASG